MNNGLFGAITTTTINRELYYNNNKYTNHEKHNIISGPHFSRSICYLRALKDDNTYHNFIQWILKTVVGFEPTQKHTKHTIT